MLALLVGVSLILLSAYFGESPGSPLHSVQRGIVGVLSPVQEGASKILSPVRDVAGWFSDTLSAKSRADRLQNRVAELQKQNDYYRLQAIQAPELARQVGLDNSLGISAYHPVTANVIGRDPTFWYQTIQVDHGSSDGVTLDDPVVGDGALVGKVTTVDNGVSVVTLITDHSYSVAAEVEDPSGDSGLLVPAVGSPNQMLLQDLPRHAAIQAGQPVVTAGFKDGPLASLYPRGLPIGYVSNAAQLQNELINNQQVSVTPAADLRRLSFVQILTRPHGGSVRAQLP